MKGMKIRVMENPVYIDIYKALGSYPTPMAVNEIYLGLKQGVIDGVDIPPYAFMYWKLQEAAKFCSYTDHLNHRPTWSVVQNGLIPCQRTSRML